MDGLLDILASIFSSPFLIFILITAAVALSIISLFFTLILARKISSIITSIKTSQPTAIQPSSIGTAVKTTQKPSATGFVRVAGGLESLEEISSTLAVNSIFLFNLAGMSIEAYNIKEEDKLAAILADILASLRKNGFPTEIIALRDSIQGYILSVTQVGEMEVFALILGGPEVAIDVEEARQLLKDYVTSMIKRGG
ncbi:MAG: hypothetical protein LZ171_04130 [Thaumarchaeota archaeon]|nr:hypothetical protein [Candidatus Geocrenenecus arthurdayi]MCL7391213.1 hypothetical protein [Candidatus Geocrenenecus arthurdayi]